MGFHAANDNNAPHEINPIKECAQQANKPAYPSWTGFVSLFSRASHPVSNISVLQSYQRLPSSDV
jgi:hypothetical protein